MPKHSSQHKTKPKGKRKLLREFVRDYPRIHLSLGLLGNATFLVGSVFFLYEPPLQTVGTWLFIIGSLGMLLGSIGSVLVKVEKGEW